MTKIIPNRAEIIAINDQLRDHLLPQSDGTYIYESGYNDERIAKEVAPRLRWSNVKGLRLELFGHLQREPKTKSLSKRVEELEKRVEKVEVCLAVDLSDPTQ